MIRRYRSEVCENDGNVFENEGWKAKLHHDGKEGLDAFLENQNKWGVVILDVNLPSMDGMQFAAKSAKWTKCSNRNAYSNAIQKVTKVIGLEIGADDYVCKTIQCRNNHGSY